MERIEVLITGKVQEVSFRLFTQNHARTLGVLGHVRNLPDGNVHVVAEGSRPTLETFVAHLRRGPQHAYVEDVSVEWLAASGSHDSFEIAR